MMTCEIRIDYGVISAVLMGLFLFGTGYNTVVSWLEKHGYTEGYLGLLVAFGVIVTLVGVAILSVQAALIALVAFIASGVPMIVGSIFRYLRKREEAKRSIIEEIND